MANKPVLKYFLFALLLLYMLLLSKYILITRMHNAPEHYLSLKHIKASIESGMRTANLEPFKTIRLLYRSRHISTAFQYKNLGGNVVGFVPLGILLPSLFRKLHSFAAVIAAVFAVSLSFECIQLCTGLGVFDVDDLILNTAGGITGFALHFCAALIYRQPLAKTAGI